jgi:hypothetical protein
MSPSEFFELLTLVFLTALIGALGLYAGIQLACWLLGPLMWKRVISSSLTVPQELIDAIKGARQGPVDSGSTAAPPVPDMSQQPIRDAEVEPAVVYRCPHCGSDNVLWDGWAAWFPDLQEFSLSARFDHHICGDCEAGSDGITAVECPVVDWGLDHAQEEWEYNPSEVNGAILLGIARDSALAGMISGEELGAIVAKVNAKEVSP